jgi:hypothetical protein
VVRVAEPAVADLGARLRQDPLLRNGQETDRVQLENHTATFLVDIGLALVTLDEGGGEPELLRDGTEIQRLIAHRHGAQRARLGWTEVRKCGSAVQAARIGSAGIRFPSMADRRQGMRVPPGQERMNSPLENREVRLRGLPVPHAAGVHRSEVFAGEAPRSVRGLPQSLRRLQPLRPHPGRCEHP